MPISNTNISNRTRVKSGRKVVATAGTPEALGSGAYQYVIIQSETNNTGGVVFGGSDVDETAASRTGFYLNPGESSPILPIVDLADIYLDVNVNTDGVHYTAFSPE